MLTEGEVRALIALHGEQTVSELATNYVLHFVPPKSTQKTYHLDKKETNMSTGGAPGFVTTLPLVALIGLFGSSATIAYCIRVLATRYETPPPFSTGSLTLISVLGHLAVLFTAGTVLAAIGGIPASPSFFGPAVPVLLFGYGLPLVVIAVLIGKLIEWRSQNEPPRRFVHSSSTVFAFTHLLSIPTVWAMFVLIELLIHSN
ncbi:hypothetical protein [Haloferax massiliensis]|uniref:hypothetical protein n=1 Tax=Haloferax massiliensis TaxID=1476858 RepID=UPI0011118B44|nr:hypothetical protein [Haloferax massiliensis]